MTASPAEPDTIRVAMIVRPAAGGIRNHVGTLLAHLDPRRFYADLLAPSDFTLPAFAPETRHIPLSIGAKTDPAADWRTIGDCARILRQNRYHIIHAHGLRAALIGTLAAKRAGVPAICTAHNLLVSPSLLERLAIRLISRRALFFIAVSEAVRNSLTAVGVPWSKTFVIPNGVDLMRFPEFPAPKEMRTHYGVPADAPHIVGMGRFSREKGFDILLTAMNRVWEQIPQAHLILAGSGPEEDTYRQIAEQSGGRILLPGFVEDTPSLLASADVVAIPSREEGQGIVALEAMAARVPVVASCVGGLPETVTEGVTGLLIAPENPEALAQALIDLLTDRARCEAMGGAGRKRVEEFYSAVRMAEQVQMLYAEAKANRR